MGSSSIISFVQNLAESGAGGFYNLPGPPFDPSLRRDQKSPVMFDPTEI